MVKLPMPAHGSIDGMPLIDRERMEFLQEIQLTGNRYHGLPYGNIAVDGPRLARGYDPDMRAAVTHFAMQWEGANPLPGGGATFDIATTESGAEAFTRDQIRSLILDAHIGSAALRRIPEELQEAHRSIELVGDLGVAMLTRMYQLARAPLGVLQVGRVIESTVVPVGETVAHLWYPATLSPTGVLDRMRTNLRDIMIAERG